MFCQSLYEPILSDEELEGIEYTGREFEDACSNLEKFCQAVPADGCWLDYLLMADELNYLEGERALLLWKNLIQQKKTKRDLQS